MIKKVKTTLLHIDLFWKDGFNFPLCNVMTAHSPSPWLCNVVRKILGSSYFAFSPTFPEAEGHYLVVALVIGLQCLKMNQILLNLL